MISGGFGPSRIWSRISLARETGREEKASIFHDMREKLWVKRVSMFRDVRESFWVTRLCALRKGMGAQLWVEWLKAERVRQSLLVAMCGDSNSD